MGSNCCSANKEPSPKVSLRKFFSRWTNRFTKSDSVKIADAEDVGYSPKKRESVVVSDPAFESPEAEDHNHVTMLLPDAPRVPSRKKSRISNKRVSFQSDVEIMRTSSSKSLDRYTVSPPPEEQQRSRSASFDSFFDKSSGTPSVAYLKERRTSSLEHITFQEMPIVPNLIDKLRRDTLGDALDFQSYKRPLVFPKPSEAIQEESDQSEEDVTSFKLAAKLRRDTLGDALHMSRRRQSPTGSSSEDLEETVKHSKLCSKLRRDTFGDALKQAVHCKACLSLEDITELEVPLPETPELDEESNQKKTEISVTVTPTPEITMKNVTAPRITFHSNCKTCMSLEAPKECRVCSNENISQVEEAPTRKPNGILKINIEQKKGCSFENVSPSSPKQLYVTDQEISSTLERIRTTGKIEPKEPYNVVYSSSIKGPFGSSKENLCNNESGKSASTQSLDDSLIIKSYVLNSPDKNRNHIIT